MYETGVVSFLWVVYNTFVLLSYTNLQPSAKHYPLDRYYAPEEFDELGIIAKAKGFLLVSSSPLTRSSYHADEDFAKLQLNRNNFH